MPDEERGAEAAFLPMPAVEVLELIPLAAGTVGWIVSDGCSTDDRTWQARISAGGARSSTIVVEWRAPGWTAVRIYEGEGMDLGERERFLRSIMLLAQGAP
jgi:hypothetical protein